ncbi:MAG: PAS domain S-box protein [Sulfurospirillaceae bacterium]|nr:PAS domain S-box protein [Sulfurospirillaceae bacterium]
MRLASIFLCFLWLQPLFGLQSFQILDNHPLVYVSKPLVYTTGEFTTQKAYALFKNNAFHKLPEPAYSFGFMSEPLWLAIELQNGCMEGLFLTLKNLSLEHIEYFVFQNDVLIQAGETGSLARNKEQLFSATHSTMTLIENPEPLTYLIKIQTTSPMVAPVIIGTDAALQHFYQNEDTLLAIFMGIFIALFLYNTILYFATKEEGYLLYSLYILSIFILILSLRSFFTPLLQENLFMTNVIKLLSLQGSVLFLLFFTLNFLNIKHLHPKLYGYSLRVGILSPLLFFIMPLGAFGQSLGMIITMMVLFFCLFLGIFSLYQKNPFAKYYILAFSGFLISAIVTILMGQGMLPYTLMNYSAIFFGSSWEMILFSLALGYKIRLLHIEHHNAMQQIKTQNKMLFLQSRYTSVGELIRNITHQWKEPLGEIGSIQTNLKSTLLLQGAISNEKLLNAINLTHRIISHLAETIDTFYRFFRHQTTENQEFNINNEIANIQKMIKYTFDTEHITLHFTHSEEPIVLLGHPNELSHSILNIILNAKDALIKRHTPNPKVSVSVSATATEAIICIADNAGGIKQKPLFKIFDAGTSSHKENIGIGLYIAKTIIEQKMHGHISVENGTDGAIFTIVLPLASYKISYHHQQQPLTLEESALERISKLEKDVARRIEIEKNLQQWAKIFEHANWGIAICNHATHTFDLINPSFAAMHGYSIDELVNQPFETIFPPGSKDNFDAILEYVHQNNHYVCESIHITQDGLRFPVELDIMAIRDESGNILYNITNVRDISEYKRTHEKLLLKKFAIDHIQDAVFLIDENANFCDVNVGACNALGYSKDELLEMNVGDIDPQWPQERWHEHWEELKILGSITMELKHQRKDGSTFPVEISANYIEFGDQNYNMSIVRNITERKATEDNLRFKEFALDTINEAVYLIDENSMFHYVNEGACKALGYTKEELLTMGVVNIDPNCTLMWWEKQWKDSNNHKTILIEAIHRRKNDTLLPVEISIKYLEFHGITYHLAIARDISERLLLEERKSDEQMRLFFEKQIIGMAISSPDKYWLRVNERLCTIFGYTKEELLALTWEELTYEEDREPDVRQFERVLKGEIEGFSMPKRFLKKNGSLIYTNLSTTCIRKEDGTADYFLTSIEDITEQVKAHDILIQKERELRLLADSSPGMMGSFYLRPDGTMCMPYVSPNIFDLFGLYPHEVIDDATALLQKTHPEDNQRVKESIAHSAQTMSLWHEEYRINHPTKGMRWMESNTRPQPHPEGGIIWYGYVHDITERKIAEKALIEKTDELQKALELNEGIITAIPDLLFEITPDGTYIGVWAQNETLLAAQKETLLGKNFKEVLPPTVVITSLQAFKEVDKKNFSFGHTYSLDFSDGKRWFELSVSKQKRSGNYIILSRDITERKKTEEMIKELNATLEAKVEKRTLELQHALEFNEGVINALPDLLFEIDFNGKYLNVWARDEKLLAQHKELLLGHTIYDVLSPEAANTIMEALNEANTKGVSFEKIIKIDLPQGSMYFEESVSKKMSTNTFLVLSHDITKRKKAEETLIKSEEAFRAMVDNSPDVIARYDLECHRIYVNPQMQRLLDKPLEEILGKKPNEASPLIGLVDFEALVKSVINEKHEIIRETPFCMPDGKMHWGIMRIIPEFNAKEEVVSILLIGKDVSEEKESKKGLQLLEAALNNADEAFYIIDCESTIRFANVKAYEMLGYEKETLLGLHLNQIDVHLTQEAIKEIADSVVLGKTITFETKHKMRHGAIIDIEIKATYFQFGIENFGVAFARKIEK